MVEDYRFTAVADGNGNGLRTSDILGGIDTPLGPAEMLAWNFPSVTFGLLPGIPDADGSTAGGTDGVRVGVSRIVSMNPNGSATSGISLPPWPAAGAVCRPSAGGDGSCAHTQIRRR